MFHKILVAVDHTEMDRHVFNETVSLAKAMNARLMLLHVLFPFDDQFLTPLFGDPYIIYPTSYIEAKNQYIKQWEEIKQEGVNFLALLCNQASAAGVTTEFTPKAGDPGRTICEVARTWKADLIMMGRRGHSGLNELLLGSVSNYVLHHAPCSVLTVQGGIHAATADVPQMQAASTRL